MKFHILLCFLCLFSLSVFAQHPIGDKLEQLYSQGHYGIVYRKSGKYLQKEETNKLISPKYYRAISTLQKANNLYWFNRHQDQPQLAFQVLEELKKTKEGRQYLDAHASELYELKNDINNWLTDLHQSKHRSLVGDLAKMTNQFFKDLDLANFDRINTKYDSEQGSKASLSANRIDLESYAKKYLGVPYKWGGTSADGFDCSGFTQHVLKSKGISIPRTAGDQYEKSTKLELNQVQCGDLVFFKNASKISHVGMVISARGEPLKMIHASSSVGISIVQIEGSEYWKKRFYACGTYIK